MMVRSEMNDGRSVTDCALAMASSIADDVLAAFHLLHMPAVGAIARGRVFAQRDVGVVLDRNLVVVVETIRLPNCWTAASDEASEVTPSSMSPSEAIT